MRSMAIVLYLAIIGLFTLASLFIEYLESDYYAEEIGYEYVQFVDLVTPLIEHDLVQSPDNTKSILQTWSAKTTPPPSSLSLIDRPADAEDETYLSDAEISADTDVFVLVSLFKHPSLKGKALQFRFVSSYSKEYLQLSTVLGIALYAFMALVITVIASYMYRYMNNISRVTRAVAQGDFSQTMPASRLPAMQEVANDINAMAATIEQKTSENLILSGAIHHELRIPITRIRLALDMAMQGGNEDFIRDLLSDMDTDLEELSGLMEELLTISRLRLKGVAIEKQPVDLTEALEKVVKSVSSPMLSFENLPSFSLQANPTLLDRALINIIGNAVKYAQSKIIIDGKQDEGHYTLTISDDGPGIPAEQREHIFKPFYRPDKSRTRTTGGFGLGLAIAEMVIADTGGTIEIVDSPMGGAAFVIKWKVAD